MHITRTAHIQAASIRMYATASPTGGLKIVPLPLGVVAAGTGGEPAPEALVGPVAFVSHKTQGPLCLTYKTHAMAGPGKKPVQGFRT
jgi:hypothetical protein